jgi:hypothetical protein
MVKKTFLEKGIEGASKLALLNVTDLKTIMEWNVKNGTKNNIKITIPKRKKPYSRILTF